MFDLIRQNPKAFISAVLAHALLFALLFFNLDWNQTTQITPPQVEIVQAVMVDDAKLKVEQEKKQKIEERQRKEQERLKRAAEELEKLEFEQEAEQRRAEQSKRAAQERQQREANEQKQAAEVRQKRAAEEKRAATEAEKRKAEAEKQRKQDEERQRQTETEKKKKQDTERKAAEERKRQEAEERRLLDEQLRQEELAADEARLQAARQSELDSEKNKYMFMIQKRVESKWLKPSGWQRGTNCKVRVRLVPGAGTAQVIDVRVIKSCGQPLFDRSVESAVFSASPLPFPTAPELMNQFREIVLDFKPEG
jgi:colicin import membrane protein